MPNGNEGGAKGRGTGRTRTYSVAPVAAKSIGPTGRPGRRPPDRLLAQTRLEFVRMRENLNRMRRLSA
jgi:hypothetical protein